MVRRLLAIIGLLACAAAASAQTPITVGPVTITDRLGWDMPDMTSTQAQALVYFVFVDAKLLTQPLPGAAITCVAPAACKVNLTPELVTALNVVGKHAITMTAVHPEGGESAQAVPFLLRVPTGAPLRLGITR